MSRCIFTFLQKSFEGYKDDVVPYKDEDLSLNSWKLCKAKTAKTAETAHWYGNPNIMEVETGEF